MYITLIVFVRLLLRRNNYHELAKQTEMNIRASLSFRDLFTLLSSAVRGNLVRRGQEGPRGPVPPGQHRGHLRH